MEKYLGRNVIEQKEFKVEGTFQSMYAAQKWVTEKGYEYGSTCAMYPCALVKGEYTLPQKWKNFTKKEQNNVDGVMTGDNREGPVFVYLFK